MTALAGQLLAIAKKEVIISIWPLTVVHHVDSVKVRKSIRSFFVQKPLIQPNDKTKKRSEEKRNEEKRREEKKGKKRGERREEKRGTDVRRGVERREEERGLR